MLAAAIRSARQQRGLSLRAVSAIIGASPAWLNRLEHGQGTTARRLAALERWLADVPDFGPCVG